ncbi:MAG: hypothetical protein JWN65_2180 [Solirubrobacterales bacterium]|nr:hypothetical protein [Solirubrobacterales bacterium]
MSAQEFDEMGPIDYVVLEWPQDPSGDEVVPLLLDLVDRGIIRMLDVVFASKDEDGTITAIDVADLGPASAAFGAFEGARSGLVDEEDLQAAASALLPGTSAAILVWENRWAAPVATAMRRTGGQLVASGRIHPQAVLASLDALEAVH